MSGRTTGAGVGFRTDPAGMNAIGATFRPSKRPARSRKVWTMLSKSGYEVLTPWGAKQKGKRRAARKVAKQARKVNRG